jgi:hypothetical protein
MCLPVPEAAVPSCVRTCFVVSVSPEDTWDMNQSVFGFSSCATLSYYDLGNMNQSGFGFSSCATFYPYNDLGDMNQSVFGFSSCAKTLFPNLSFEIKFRVSYITFVLFRRYTRSHGHII